MGFSSEWMSIMKGIVPPAFTEKPCIPNLKGVIIDGQIQLMKPNFVNTMELFYKVQFINLIERYFQNGPDDLVVVLAFDNYAHVPTSKSMTQVKRKSKVAEVLPFTQEDHLPTGACPPSWDGAMCNRIFKTKLIRHIVENIGDWVSRTMRKKQRLILDHVGDPMEYSHIPGASRKTDSCYVRMISNMDNCIGEADCKFPRWVDHIASMFPSKAVDVVVEATDSDYVMIAMMHYEARCADVLSSSSFTSLNCDENSNVIQHQQQQNCRGLGRISVRRIHTRGKEHSSSEGSAKRKRGDTTNETQPSSTTTIKKKAKRMMEFVHIPLLYEVMSCIMKELFPQDQGNSMKCLAALIALAGGNDFCRNLPRLGPHRLWELLPLVLRPKKEGSTSCVETSMFSPISFCHATNKNKVAVLNEDLVCNALVAKVYAEIYSNHTVSKSNTGICMWDTKTFQSLCDCLKSDSCKLSAGIKEEFPILQRVVTTVRNASWNILYWECAVKGDMSGCPDPIDERFGYTMGADGKPKWMDLV